MKLPITLPAALMLSSLSVFAHDEPCASFPVVSETTLAPFFSHQSERLYISDIEQHPNLPLAAIAVNTPIGNSFVQLVDISDPLRPVLLGKVPGEPHPRGDGFGEPISDISWSGYDTLAVTIKGHSTPLRVYDLFNNSDLTGRREWWSPDNLSIPSTVVFHPNSSILYGLIENLLLQFDTNNTYQAYSHQERRLSSRFNLTDRLSADSGKTFTSLAFNDGGDGLFVGQSDGTVHSYSSRDPLNPVLLSESPAVKGMSRPINAIIVEELSDLSYRTYQLSQTTPTVFSTTLFYNNEAVEWHSFELPNGVYGKLERDSESGILAAIGDNHLFFKFREGGETPTLKILYSTPNPSYNSSEFSYPPQNPYELFGLKFIGDGRVAMGGNNSFRIHQLITDNCSNSDASDVIPTMDPSIDPSMETEAGTGTGTGTTYGTQGHNGDISVQTAKPLLFYTVSALLVYLSGFEF